MNLCILASFIVLLKYWLQRDGKTTYHNSWVTDIAVDEKNIVELVKAGRCKWKIENETFYTLKNQGYHIEHNFGHGKKPELQFFPSQSSGFLYASNT